tara:strand:- start:100 stop:258 length:159 start_codon:yes stop_codon:yes gene_type:complete
MTKKTMFETVFPNANTGIGIGITFTEEKLFEDKPDDLNSEKSKEEKNNGRND